MEKEVWGRRIRAYRKLTNQLVGQIADALNITVEELSPNLEEERRGNDV